MDFRNILKKMRELDPTTPGEDLQRFTQLAESTGISLGAKEVVTEAKKDSKVKEAAKPDFLDMDKDGDKKEPMKKAAKDAKKKKEVKEGGVGNLKIEMEDDAAQMSKEEFIKAHGEKYAHIWDRVQGQMKGDPKYDESRVNEAEQVIKAEKKQKLPSKKSILMMCSKGMSVKEMCEEYPDCDQKKLKEMCESCMEEYKKKNESVTFKDMDGEIVEAKSAAQKKAQEKFKNMVKGKKSDDKEMDEAKEPKKKKETVKESAEPMKFIEMMKLVRESGGQQAIDPMDDTLWTWANRVAKSKVEESNKQEIFAAMVYERNGGRFEMYDVVEKGLNEGKECNCGPDCACKGNCGSDCNCGPDCGK